MRKFGILSALSTAAVLFASGAALADESATGSVVYKNASGWTGFHAGVTGGYGWGKADLDAVVGGMSEDGSAEVQGGMIGGLAGYDVEFGNGFVAGILGDISWSGIGGDSCLHGGGVSCSDSNSSMKADLNWLGTIRARAGFAFDDALFYVTGGGAIGGVETSLHGGKGNLSDSQTQLGWTVGAGIEYRLSEPVTLGIEYLYVDLGKQSYHFADDAEGDVDINTQLLRATLQWRF